MSKQLYILFYVIMTMKFWSIRPIGHINDDLFFIIILFYLLYGWFHFKTTVFNIYQKEMMPFWISFIAIILSMIPAYLYFNQSFLQSFITYRYNIAAWLFLPVLFKMSPSWSEIAKSMLIFGSLTLFFGLLELYYPNLFVLDERMLRIRASSEIKQEAMLKGYVLITIPVFYYLYKIKELFNFKYLLIVFFCYAAIFVSQNRSTLFPITIIILWNLMFIKSRYKFVIILLVVSLCVFVFISTIDIWYSLYEETTLQVDDSDYNRNLAYKYIFSWDSRPGIVSYFLGLGFLSAHASSAVIELRSMGINFSDVGLFGYAYEWGPIPAITAGYLYIATLYHYRRFNSLMTMFALFMMVASTTIGYLYGPSLILYQIFYYSYFSVKSENEIFSNNTSVQD